jgi:hypothetical protein
MTNSDRLCRFAACLRGLVAWCWAVQNVHLASHSTGTSADGTAGVSSHASTAHVVHTRPTCFADCDDHIVLLVEGREWHSLRE